MAEDPVAAPRTLALAVIGQNVVIDFGSHEAAMEGINRVRIDRAAEPRDSSPPPNSCQCQCYGCRAASHEVEP